MLASNGCGLAADRDTVSESINRRKADLFEELGIEADDGDLLSEQQLIEPKSNKRRCY